MQSTDPEPRLRISLLGGFQVCVDGQVIPTNLWKLSRARRLVKYLALAPGLRMHREQLMETLWPERSRASSIKNLYQAVYMVRKALGPAKANATGVLHLQGEIICLDSATWVDVNMYESAVAAARQTKKLADYHRAIDAYPGDLLPEDRYDDLISSRRDALHYIYCYLLWKAAQLEEKQTSLSTAIELLEKLVNIDPLHEKAHSGLMRLYAATGERELAIHQYQLLRSILNREMNHEPDAQTTTLYHQILAAR